MPNTVILIRLDLYVPLVATVGHLQCRLFRPAVDPTKVNVRESYLEVGDNENSETAEPGAHL